MWPLSLVLLFATTTPQQQDVNAQLWDQVFKAAPEQAFKLATQTQGQLDRRFTSKQILDDQRSNTCYTVRSYYFQRQDGQAPVLVGTSTCTPANKLQQRQVNRRPGSGFVPLSLQVPEQAPPE